MIIKSIKNQHSSSKEVNWYERNPSLDGLRGVLALTVCFTHAWAAIIAPWLGGFNLLHGMFSIPARLAVVSFFVLSGYAICVSVQQNIKKYSEFSLYDWGLNRVLRIYPPLIVSVVICLLLIQITQLIDYESVTPYPLARGVFNYDMDVVLKSLISIGFEGRLTGSVYSGFNGPMWSLAIEMQLYVLVGLLVVILRGALILKIIFSFVLFYLIKYEVLSAFESSLVKLGYLSFAMGYIASRFRGEILIFSKDLLMIVGGGVMLIAICILMNEFLNDYNYLRELNSLESIGIQLVYSIGFSIILVSIKGKVAKLFANKWVSQTGRFSYTLYIIHFPLLVVLASIVFLMIDFTNMHMVLWLVWALSIIFVVFVAYYIARFVENPKTQKAWLMKTVASILSK